MVIVEPTGSLLAAIIASRRLIPAPPGVPFKVVILVVLPLFSSTVVLTVTDCALTAPIKEMKISVKISLALLKKFNFLKAGW